MFQMSTKRTNGETMFTVHALNSDLTRTISLNLEHAVKNFQTYREWNDVSSKLSALTRYLRALAAAKSLAIKCTDFGAFSLICDMDGIALDEMRKLNRSISKQLDSLT